MSNTSIIELENAVQLKVSDFSLPEITDNSRLLLEQVRDAVANFSPERYEGNEGAAKGDRAALNKLIKGVKETKSAIRKRWLLPLETFEKNCDLIAREFETAADIPDGIVKELKRKYDEQKRRFIEGYWESKEFDLVTLDWIFDPKWLNKTVKLEEVYAEIDKVTADIYSGIKTLEGLPEYVNIAKAEYLQTLDIGAALRKVEALKENAERLAREKAEREGREAREEEKSLQEREVVDVGKIDTRAAALVDAVIGESETGGLKEPEYTFTFTFTATEKKCRELRKFMLDNGIDYEKVDMSLYELADADL